MFAHGQGQCGEFDGLVVGQGPDGRAGGAARQWGAFRGASGPSARRQWAGDAAVVRVLASRPGPVRCGGAGRRGPTAPNRRTRRPGPGRGVNDSSPPDRPAAPRADGLVEQHGDSAGSWPLTVVSRGGRSARQHRWPRRAVSCPSLPSRSSRARTAPAASFGWARDGGGVAASVGDAFQQHPDVQRVPAGVAGEHGGQGFGSATRTAATDPARDVLIGQPAEPDDARGTEHARGRGVSRRADRRCPGRCRRPAGGTAQFTGHVREQPQRRPVRPVQVLQDDHQNRRRGRGDERVARVGEHREPRRGGLAGSWCSLPAGGPPGGHVLGDPAPRPQRRHAAIVDERARAPPAPRSPRHRGQGGDQAGLPIPASPPTAAAARRPGRGHQRGRSSPSSRSRPTRGTSRQQYGEFSTACVLALIRAGPAASETRP